jgi:hypothetical protein
LNFQGIKDAQIIGEEWNGVIIRGTIEGADRWIDRQIDSLASIFLSFVEDFFRIFRGVQDRKFGRTNFDGIACSISRKILDSWLDRSFPGNFLGKLAPGGGVFLVHKRRGF